MKELEYEVILTSQADGGYMVSVPDLPDVVTEADIREAALAMAKGAIEAYLEAMREHGLGIPVTIHERVVVRAV